MEIIETLINGLSLGGTYAIIALGYTMVYGIAKTAILLWWAATHYMLPLPIWATQF